MDRERENSNRDTENRGMAGEDEEMKMELELDAAHALANLAGSDPIPNQASISQEEDPHYLQANVGENSKEAKGNRCRNQTLETGPSNSINQVEVSTSRGQKNLNEAERDAKRLRRILANRESARQTILRRQAFRDELARKVSILSAENLVLKKEKENATREYFYQKEMNQQLKEQMIQMTPLKEEKTLQLPLSVPAPEIPVTLSVQGNIPSYSLVGMHDNENDSNHNMATTAQYTSSACEISNEAPTVIRKTVPEVSCSLTLGLSMTKDETAEQNHETVTFEQKLNQLQSEYEWKEGCTPYLPLDATNARRRRMEIAKAKQSHRN